MNQTNVNISSYMYKLSVIPRINYVISSWVEVRLYTPLAKGHGISRDCERQTRSMALHAVHINVEPIIMVTATEPQP